MKISARQMRRNSAYLAMATLMVVGLTEGAYALLVPSRP